MAAALPPPIHNSVPIQSKVWISLPALTEITIRKPLGNKNLATCPHSATEVQYSAIVPTQVFFTIQEEEK
jgi:hypothetical protein